MIAALAPTSFGYRLLLLLHILFIIVGFGTSFVWAVMGPIGGKMGPPVSDIFGNFALKISKYLTTWPIWAAGAFGLALGIAGGRMDETWLQIAAPLFIVMVLFAAFVHVPNLTKLVELGNQLAAGGPPAGGAAGGPPPQLAEIQQRGAAAGRNGGILHLAFLVMLVLMVWQPGA
jgi:hypothetical protein